MAVVLPGDVLEGLEQEMVRKSKTGGSGKIWRKATFFGKPAYHVSTMFNKQAKTAKNQMWWKNMKLNIIIGAVVVLIVAYVVYSIGG